MQQANDPRIEDTVLGPAGNFSIAQGEFIQILHDGGAHWVCVSNIGCWQGVINYFDSLNRGQIKRHVQRQVQSIVHGIGQEVMITIQPVQQQQNSVDCGIFAIAFATSLAYGQNPAATTYDTSRIRPHLSACLATGHLSTFPVLTTEHCQRCSKKYVLLKMWTLSLPSFCVAKLNLGCCCCCCVLGLTEHAWEASRLHGNVNSVVDRTEHRGQ